MSLRSASLKGWDQLTLVPTASEASTGFWLRVQLYVEAPVVMFCYSLKI